MRIERFPRLSAVVLVLGLLAAACGGGATDTASGGEATEGGGGGSAQPSGELVVWHYYDAGAGGLERAVGEWETNFEEDYPDIDVRLEYQPYDQIVSKVTTAAAAQQGPDIVFGTHPFLPELVKAGAVVPLDGYWDSYEDAGQYPAQITDGLTIDDELYGVQAYANIMGLYYNADILDEIGVEVPTDMATFEAAMTAAQEAGYTALTVSAPAGSGGEFAAVPWLIGQGWSYDDPANDGSVTTMRMLSDWVEQGFVNSDDATGFNGGTNFLTGNYAFAQEGNWNLATFDEEAGFEYGVAAFPGVDQAAIGGEVISIGSGAENPDTAWRFITEQVLSQEGGRAAAEAGSIPLREDTAADPVVTENEQLSVYADVAAQSVSIPLDDASPEVSEVIGSAFNEVIAGSIDAQDAADRIGTQLGELRPEG